MPAGDIEVVRIDGAWHVRKQGRNGLDIATYQLKASAVIVGRAFARYFGVELIVKKRNGRIGSRDSHGHDPSTIPH